MTGRVHTVMLSLVMVGVIAADPAWRGELTTAAAPAAVRAMPPSVLDFKVSWKGLLDAGRLRIEFAPEDADKPGMLVVRSHAASTGAASALFPYTSHFWSEMHPATLRPGFFHAVETDRREKIDTTLQYRPRQVEFIETSEDLKDRKTVREHGVFRFEPVYDIFSAMLFVRGQKLAPGDRVTLVVQPFKTPYLVRVRVAARERHMGRPALRLAVAMRKIDRDTLELRPYRKLRREATLWLSDDADRVPLELRAAVFIGDVRAVLTDFRKLQP